MLYLRHEVVSCVAQRSDVRLVNQGFVQGEQTGTNFPIEQQTNKLMQYPSSASIDTGYSACTYGASDVLLSWIRVRRRLMENAHGDFPHVYIL